MQEAPNLKLWSIGGGKGGVGKSSFTLGLGVMLAQMGNRVILVDGDLGGANLHTMMGLRYPPVTLEDFLLRKVGGLNEVVLKTPVDGIGLICGADDVLGAANPTYYQKIRLLRELQQLPADYVLVDLGAGTSFNVLDLFNHSPGKIAVFTGLATSLQNAYGFIKCALFRRISREFAKDDDMLSLLYDGEALGEAEAGSLDSILARLRPEAPEKASRLAKILRDYRLFMVTNIVRNDQDLRSAEIIQSVCQDFLSIEPEVLGQVFYDSIVEVVINQMEPALLYERENRMAKGLEQIAKRILRLSRGAHRIHQPEPKTASKAPAVPLWRQAWEGEGG